MIGIAITVALVVLIGSLILHSFYTYGEYKGYMRGLDDAEEIFKSVRIIGYSNEEKDGYVIIHEREQIE